MKTTLMLTMAGVIACGCAWAEPPKMDVAQPTTPASNVWEKATGQQIMWGGIEMTTPEPRIVPVSVKKKIRERMSPQEIVETFGRGWMSKRNSVGSISWRFADGSMIFILFRNTPVDQVVDVHQSEPPKGEKTEPTNPPYSEPAARSPQG